MSDYHQQCQCDPTQTCDVCAPIQKPPSSFAAPACSAAGYKHPTSLMEFEAVYRKEYDQALESCDGWIKWCERQNPPDTHGMNFHQGLRSAHIFNNIKMEQLIRVLKQEPPNEKGQK